MFVIFSIESLDDYIRNISDNFSTLLFFLLIKWQGERYMPLLELEEGWLNVILHKGMCRRSVKFHFEQRYLVLLEWKVLTQNFLTFQMKVFWKCLKSTKVKYWFLYRPADFKWPKNPQKLKIYTNFIFLTLNPWREKKTKKELFFQNKRKY